MAHCSDYGDCHETYTVGGRYVFEAKTYSVEESVMLRRDTFARTQILQHQNLDGEVPTGGGGDIQGAGRFVTYHEDVQVGSLKPIYRDEIVSMGWYSKANGYPDKMCGFVGGSTTREVQVKINLCTTTLHQEEEICMKQFLGSWRQTSLARGVLNKQDNVFISDDIFYAFEKQNVIGIDKHFWHGDYQSADSSVMHFDGVIKKAVLALGNEQGEIFEFDIQNLVAGLCIEGRVGGQSFIVNFNTDNNTTLDDFVTVLAGINKGNEGRPLFNLVQRTGTVVRIEARSGESIQGQMQFLVTNCDGFNECPDGTIERISDVPGSVVCVATQIQAAVSGNTPIAIPWEPVSTTNVLEKLEELYVAIQDAKPQILDPSFNGTLFVAPNVWTAMQFRLKKEVAAFQGSNGPLQEVFDLCGFSRIVKANYLGRNEMIYFRPDDVHVSTDLVRDVQALQQGFDRKCETYWVKNAFAMGVEISEPANVAGTLCNRQDSFGAAMPCTATDITYPSSSIKIA